ncbi:VanZ family protein [Paenibacillus antri]|nr:VanZ family protein [Paenibacillus antri]
MHLSRYTLLSLGVLFEAAHLFQFGILYAALVVAALTFGPLTKRGEAFALLLSALYALLDEAHQYFVPFRSATLTDLAKDVVGVAVVWWAIRRSYRSQRSKLGQALRKCSAAFSKI